LGSGVDFETAFAHRIQRSFADFVLELRTKNWSVHWCQRKPVLFADSNAALLAAGV